MAEFNNKNTNKKPYAKSGSNDNRRGSYDKKPNYSGDKNVKEFKKNYSDSDKDYKKPYAGKKPVHQKPAAPAPVRRPRGVEAPDFAGEVIEYKMSAAMADTILKADKSKRPPQEVLCEYVNTQCGLKGYCVRVSYF